MLGNWKWNLVFGIAGAIVVFLFSWNNNPFATAFIRSAYCFLILFLLMFFIRFFLGTIVGMKLDEEMPDEKEGQMQANLGSRIDLSTPEEDLPAEQKSQASETNSSGEPLRSEDNDSSASFTPIDPPKLAKKSDDEGKKWADSIRQISEEEGR